MNKFLNFSTILCSYILITLLVISCGGGGDGGEASSNNDVNNGTSQPDDQPDDTGDQYSSDSGDQSDDTGDISGGQGSAGSNSKVVQADLSDKTCLLADRADKEAVVAVLCQGYRFIGLIPKATPDQEVQQLDFLIFSIANPDWDSSPISESPSISQLSSRTWDLSEAVKLQISYAKDYTLSLDDPTYAFIDMIADDDATSDEYLLNSLNITHVLNDPFRIESYSKTLRSVGITFSPTSGSAIKAAISGKLAVKTQEDFISMANFKIPGLRENSNYQVPFLLLNNLSLAVKRSLPSTGILPPIGILPPTVTLPPISLKSNDLNLIAEAPDPDPKFTSPIIPRSEGSFDFDGGGHKITLDSEINTLDSKESAAIIGYASGSTTFRNFTLDVNAPISGTNYVGIIIGIGWSEYYTFKDLKINLNRNLTLVYQYPHQSGVGGLAGRGLCKISVNNVVFKRAEDAAIQIKLLAPDKKPVNVSGWLHVGGLTGEDSCSGNHQLQVNNSVVDVKIVFDAVKPYNENYTPMQINGLMGDTFISSINNNLIKVAVRGENLPADHSFYSLAGLMPTMKKSINNLVYLDFSNIGKVKKVGGLFVRAANESAYSLQANNMVFIADGFNTGNVTEQFGASVTNTSIHQVIAPTGPELFFMNNFFSSPFTDFDYNTNGKLASFVYSSTIDMTFNNLILDNKNPTVMLKGEYVERRTEKRQDRFDIANLFTLAEAKTTPIETLFSEGNTSWEEGSHGYPQLKAPAHFSAAKKADWDIMNDMIQAGLAARDARNQWVK